MTALPEDNELASLLSDLNDIKDVAPVSLSTHTTPLVSAGEQSNAGIQGPQGNTLASQEITLHHEGDAPPPTTIGIDLGGLYDQSIQELLLNYRKDRQDLDSYINFIYGKLNHDGPSRIFFEAIAMSLRTKSEANTNLIKLIDNIGRRIEKQTGVEDLNLEGLLDD